MNLLFFIICLIQPWADIGRAQGQPPECSVTFEIVNAGFKTTGRLSAVVKEFSFNPLILNENRIVILASPSSIATGIEIRDKHLQREDFFHTVKYPQIILQSTGFKKSTRNKFLGTFELTIKGKTELIKIPFAIRKKNNGILYEGVFQIRRSDFGIGESSLTLADEVLVQFAIFELGAY